jgi:hypothetical protein
MHFKNIAMIIIILTVWLISNIYSNVIKDFISYFNNTNLDNFFYGKRIEFDKKENSLVMEFHDKSTTSKIFAAMCYLDNDSISNSQSCDSFVIYHGEVPNKKYSDSLWNQANILLKEYKYLKLTYHINRIDGFYHGEGTIIFRFENKSVLIYKPNAQTYMTYAHSSISSIKLDSNWIIYMYRDNINIDFYIPKLSND